MGRTTPPGRVTLVETLDQLTLTSENSESASGGLVTNSAAQQLKAGGWRADKRLLLSEICLHVCLAQSPSFHFSPRLRLFQIHSHHKQYC